MTDIAFGEGTAGALLQAAVATREKTCCLSLMLDIGPLDDLPIREETLRALYGRYPGVAEVMAVQTRRALRALDSARDEIRVWVSADDPAEMCGLCWLCDHLSASPVRLFIPGSLPGTAHSMGELPPSDLQVLAAAMRPLREDERARYRQVWHALQEENAPLRALINGALMGVPEDFYDFILRAHVPQGEFVLARLLGEALRHMPGVSDAYLFTRVCRMLETGELTVVCPPRESDGPYSGVLRRAAQK